jgi:ribose transport system ATP-binding protein
VTVLKDGRTVAAGLSVRDTPPADLIRLMTGRTIEHVFPARRRPPAGGSGEDGAPALLEVSGLTLPGVFAGVGFRVRAGEIVGLAGLVGSGRSEVLETVYGARRAAAGTVTVDGRRLRPGSVGAAVAAGVGLCPEERKSQALLLDESVARNVSLATLRRFARGGFVDRSGERRAAEEHTTALDVRPAGVERTARTLSGGNQQKVVLARWLLRGCRVLLLDEPTRGVDVGARSEIYALIRQLADDGVAVVLVSSEIPEVLGLADRVVVLREGRVVHEGPAAGIDEHGVLDLVMEHGSAPAAAGPAKGGRK